VINVVLTEIRVAGENTLKILHHVRDFQSKMQI